VLANPDPMTLILSLQHEVEEIRRKNEEELWSVRRKNEEEIHVLRQENKDIRRNLYGSDLLLRLRKQNAQRPWLTQIDPEFIGTRVLMKKSLPWKTRDMSRPTWSSAIPSPTTFSVLNYQPSGRGSA